MDWLSELIDWANQNEGLLQALAMLGGIGALLISLRRQRAETTARTQAAEPVPAKVVVRPVSEDRLAALTSVFAGYGAKATTDGQTLTTPFTDADDAARAALGVQQALSQEDRGATEILVCARAAPVPEASEANRGSVVATAPIRKALLDAPDLAVREGEPGSLPFVVEAAAPRSPLQVMRRWALPAVGAALIVLGATWLLFSSEPEQKPIRSIAVLPLENLSGDPDQEHVADGMTEAFISEFAKIGSLRVISRTSAMHYKGVRRPLPEIARELGVEAILEGSYQRVGDRVRVTVQLVNAIDDEHLWAEGYDREARDILDLQREVARTVATAAAAELTPGESERLKETGPVDPEAYEAYLRGRHFWNRREAWLRRAKEEFEKAIEIDPEYAPAFAGLAATYMLFPHYLNAAPRETFPKAKEYAERALQLDPSLAEAHVVLGDYYLRFEWDWVRAGEEYRRASESSPGSSMVRQFYGEYLWAVGQTDAAIAQFEQARAIDPISPISISNLALGLVAARRPEEALTTSDAALEIDPSFALAHTIKGLAYMQTGEGDRAIASLRRSVGISDWSGTRFHLARALALFGHRDEAQKLIDETLSEIGERTLDLYALAAAYGALDQTENMYEALDRMLGEKSPFTIWLARGPAFDHVRHSPEFQAFLRRVGFPGSLPASSALGRDSPAGGPDS